MFGVNVERIGMQELAIVGCPTAYTNNPLLAYDHYDSRLRADGAQRNSPVLLIEAPQVAGLG